MESKFKNRNTLEEGSGILVYPEPLSLFVLGPTWSDLINVEDSDWESDANDEANTFEEHEKAQHSDLKTRVENSYSKIETIYERS